MKYVGIHRQQVVNNRKTILLMIGFPLLVFALLFLGCVIIFALATNGAGPIISPSINTFRSIAPKLFLVIAVWFAVAYFIHSYIIEKTTHSATLSRSQNKRVYNIVENLCISRGMRVPKINVIEDCAMNAFASGINQDTYAITLTRGLIDGLQDDELEGVVAHELTHIRNNDVRLLVVAIVFVGIFSLTAQIAFNAISRGHWALRGKKAAGSFLLLVLIMLLATAGYAISTVMRFSISRRREYVADAGAAELTKNPKAMASALRKISGNAMLHSKTESSVAQLFIENPPPVVHLSFTDLFYTHPPIERRIYMLDMF